MDTLLQTLISWQFILFCLGIAAITEVLRRAVDFFVLDNPKMPGTRTSKLWRDFLLPVAPLFNGVIIAALAVKYPYPEDIKSFSARAFFGLVAGLFSGLLYRIISGLLKAKAPANDTSDEELQKLAEEVAKTINKE